MIVNVKTVIFIKINYLRTRDIHKITFEVSLTCKEKAYIIIATGYPYITVRYIYLYAVYYTNNVYSSTTLQYSDNICGILCGRYPLINTVLNKI